MEFSEVRSQFSKFSAYAGWITVEDAKLFGDIPAAYADIFDNRCVCGSENIIAPNLRREMCCNPRCYVKEAYKLAKMFSDFGVLGVGYSTCESVYGTLKKYDQLKKDEGETGLFKYHTYTEVLMIPWEKYPESVKGSAGAWDFFAGCLAVRKANVTFAQLIASLGLTGIGSNADKIFNGIDTFPQFKSAVEDAGGLISFCTGKGIHSPEVIYNIAVSIEDIAVASYACQGSIRRAGLYKLPVCITGGAQIHDKSVVKDVFIRKCNELCIDSAGVPLMEIVNKSGPATVPFVLYKDHSGSGKYNTGKKRGIVHDEFGAHRVLMSTMEFYDWLEGAMEEWNKQKDTAGADWVQILSAQMKKISQPTSQQEQNPPTHQAESF